MCSLRVADKALLVETVSVAVSDLSNGFFPSQVWRYSEGDVTHVGLGHSSPITRQRLSPDQKMVVTVSEDGGIFLWDLPKH